MADKIVELENNDKKKSYYSNVLRFVYFPSLIFYLEIIYRIFGLKQRFDYSVVYILIFSISYGTILNVLSTFFSSKINKKISTCLISIHCIMVVVQFVYYKMFYTPLALFSVTGAGQVLEFTNMVVECVLKNIIPIILLVLPIVAKLCIKSKHLIFKKTRIVEKFCTIGGVIVVSMIMFVVLSIGGKDINSDYDIYYGENIPDLVVTRFGIIKEMQKDFAGLFVNSSIKTSNLNDYLNDNDFESGDSAKIDDSYNNEDINNKGQDRDNLYYENKDVKDIADENKYDLKDEFKKVDTSPNIMDIDFDTLIENETDENIIAMHKYFSSVEPTNKNQYTGIYKDYNLILITAESFSYLAIDEELTPTLYKLSNEGFVFNNFYNPVWGVSTSDGEYVACQSLIPKSGIWSFYTSSNNYLPFVMGNQFKNLDYTTRAYHNHYYDFYSRDESHPNMGYDYKGLGNGLDVKETWPESDIEMIELTVPEYINDEKFHTYYMTVSGHKNYTFYGNYIANKNKELVENLDYSEPVKAYLACNIELDKALESLIKQLEEKGVLDKTVIAVSADHYPYGLEKNEIDELAGHEVEENFELYKSTFILWNNKQETITIDKPCSSLDIIPTLSNLFGLEYDSRLLMGRDILSDSKSLVIFANRSFITDEVMYNSLTREIKKLTDDELDSDYIKTINKVVANKFIFSAEILDRNYYAKVFGK